MVSKELLKGSIKSIILKILSENDRMYGYQLTQKVEEVSAGKIKITFGGLYPMLHKLENDGIVTTESEVVNSRMRIYYKLTRKGNEVAIVKINELRDFIETIQKFLSEDYGTPTLQHVR